MTEKEELPVRVKGTANDKDAKTPVIDVEKNASTEDLEALLSGLKGLT